MKRFYVEYFPYDKSNPYFPYWKAAQSASYDTLEHAIGRVIINPLSSYVRLIRISDLQTNLRIDISDCLHADPPEDAKLHYKDTNATK